MKLDITPDVEARFWPKVNMLALNGCWEWLAADNGYGYGVIKVSGRMVKAHRVSYELAHGEIPPRAYVLHSCDNPPCVNPAHLRAGTHAENMQDTVDRGRAPSRENGLHYNMKYTRDQVDAVLSAPKGRVSSVARSAGMTPAYAWTLRKRATVAPGGTGVSGRGAE